MWSSPGGQPSARIESDRQYWFDQQLDAVWGALVRVDRYRDWWPWLRAFDAERFEVGERWRCTVQPPVPYRVRFGVTLTSISAPHRVSASLEGDIVGTAHVTLEHVDGGCELRLTSSLAAAGVVLRFVTRWARPVAVWGHDRVLDTGVEQFRAGGLDG